MILIIMPSFVGALKILEPNPRKYMAGLTASIKTTDDYADYLMPSFVGALKILKQSPYK